MRITTLSLLTLAPLSALAVGPNGPAEFGDLPDGSIAGAPVTYLTTLVDGGPWHAQGGPIHIGAKIDHEGDGQPNAAATGDDLNNLADEDGVGVPATLQAGKPAQFSCLATNQTTAPAYFHAFIDWNGDGHFIGGGEVQTQVVPAFVANHPVNFHFNVPYSAQTNYKIGARFRLSSLAVDPHDPAPDGEVEDLMLTIEPGEFDFGDLPNPILATPGYPTLLANNGAHHVVDNTLHLGPTPADAELDGLPHSSAKGDDIDHSDDEDNFTPLSNIQAGTNTTFSQVLTNDTGADAYLHTFIDWNGDFDFSDASEYTRTLVPTGLISMPVNYTIAVPTGHLYSQPVAARVRLSSQQFLGPAGFAPDGEVEDTFITVKPALDWGDLPDLVDGTLAGRFDTGCLPDYQTRRDDNGPSHLIVEGLVIKNDSGSGDADVDFEQDGQPTPDADGDDLDGNNDDLRLLTALSSQSFNLASPVEHSTLTITVVTSQAVINTTGSDATFYAFLDGNRDGDFDDAGEVYTKVVPGDGSVTSVAPEHTFTIPWPGDLEWSEIFAVRFRFSSDATLDANGPAPDGEVQDDLISINFTIANPYPVGEELPTLWEVEENLTLLTSVQYPYQLEAFMPSEAGPFLNPVWSLNGVLLDDEDSVLSPAELAALGEGAHPLTVTFEDALGQRSVVRLSLTVRNWPAYQAWITLHGLPNLVAQPFQDPDGDGYNNLAEFALGSVPNSNNSLPPSIMGEASGHQIYSYLRRSGGVTQPDGSYHADELRYLTPTSPDLVDWSSFATVTSNPASLPAAPSNYEWATFLLPTGDQSFIRVQIENCH